ncbi:glycine zipper family protein [Gordonia tangerina]|uniref:Glycine zipper family protein n=1 Tax=Gordonia tangerina TaxID=2911060 RepID=A0ABS9DKS2_9ACTN|nr:glycine zipper family protein [Gordonia tangerina]MCF3939752.1 glycine zipper family protein [Gordonia tangerina]
MHAHPGTRTRSRGLRRHLRLLTAFSFVTVAITAFAGVAQAAPTQPAPTTYDIHTTATSFSITVHNGSISTNNGVLAIRNNAGATAFQMPLNYRKEYLQFPIDARTSGNSATLIPSRDVARAVPVNPAEVERLRVEAAKQQKAAGPQTKQERDDEALARFNQELSAGLSISSLVGTVLGAIVGGVIGCLTGLIAAIVGCLPAIPLGASLGGIVGLSLGGGGSLIYSAINYFNTINSPFVPPKK